MTHIVQDKMSSEKVPASSLAEGSARKQGWGAQRPALAFQGIRLGRIMCGGGGRVCCGHAGNVVSLADSARNRSWGVHAGGDERTGGSCAQLE